jgi:DNA-binding NtrC family response regulator
MAFSASSATKSFPRGGKDMPSHVRNALVIEDNPGLIDLLAIILDFGGYTSTTVTNAEAALAWIDQAFRTATIPSIIILDLDTRLGMERAVFLNYLRASWQEKVGTRLPLVMLKTLVNDLDHSEYQLLQKPFHVQDLLILCEKVARFDTLPESG